MIAVEDATPLSLVQDLAQIVRELRECGYKLAKLKRETVEKKHVFAVSWAKAYLAAGSVTDAAGKKPTVPAIEAKATLATADEQLAADLADAELEIIRQRIRILEREIEVGRSALVVFRAEASL